MSTYKRSLQISIRQVVLDTETTGLSPAMGHRVIEIGCLELVDRQLTGRQFHVYLNPERDVDEGAFKVHGLSDDFLRDKPLFKQIVAEFLAFVDDAELIIHNAPFDVGFLNAELKRVKARKKLESCCRVLDTLVLAKQKHPSQRNSLDALCKRYDVNNANRTLHGALLDAELLAFVYLAMTGGQIDLFQDAMSAVAKTNDSTHVVQEGLAGLSSSPVYQATVEEIALHDEFMCWLSSKQS